MVTDLVEIRRLGEQKQAENLAFRRYLSAHHRRLEPLQALASDIQQHIDCTGCANCCRYSVVAVGPADIAAIAAYLQIPEEEVIRLYTTGASAERNLKSTAEGCVFLDGNLCAIYEARPKTCREFPHVMPGEHSLGARLSSLGRWTSLCPILYNAFEEYKRRTGYSRE